jgi:hypothetical protein
MFLAVITVLQVAAFDEQFLVVDALDDRIVVGTLRDDLVVVPIVPLVGVTFKSGTSERLSRPGGTGSSQQSQNVAYRSQSETFSVTVPESNRLG